jgi:glycosyltransferase involved in cell wall biosynthesis
MKPITVYFNYQTIDGPWGGANTFLRELKHAFRASGDVNVVTDPASQYDVFFLNQLNRGPGRRKWTRNRTSIRRIAWIAKHGHRSVYYRLLPWFRFQSHGGKPIVCRLVNLVEHGYGNRSRLDRQLLKMLVHSDADIFQSHYLHEVFKAAGYIDTHSTVIPNGANQQIFNAEGKVLWDGRRPLRMFSCTFALRASKRFDLIAACAEMAGVESYHIGAWPRDVNPGRVRLLGIRPPREIADLFRREADVFIHPAERDICPNVVFEALSCKLPVLFRQVGGTAEIVRDCGVAIDHDPADAVEKLRIEYLEYVGRISANMERFSIDRAAREYAAVFRRVVESRSAQR